MDYRQRLVNRNLNPLLSSLPDWVEEYRPHQIDAVTRVMEAFDRVNVVVLDAPTGSGKTLIGETVGRMLQSRRLYICSSKILQDQFAHDYPQSVVLKGRSNYPTLLQGNKFRPGSWDSVSAEDCTWSIVKECSLCPTKFDCPYERAKRAALLAEVAVLNTSYLLTEANGPARFSGQELVIADEADTIESMLMNHVSVEVGEKRLERYGWDAPSRVTVEDSWREWLDAAITDLQFRYARLGDVRSDVRVSREARYMSQLNAKLADIREGLPTGNWVYTGRARDDVSRSRRGVSFRPARVDHLGQSFLWDHSKRWLLMSATIISSDELLSSLGYDGPYETVMVKNSFPLKNRLVKYRGVTSMSYKNRSSGSWDRLADEIIRGLREHPEDRVLVHTVSYALADHLYQRLARVVGRPVVTYNGASERVSALQQYLGCSNAVLLAPSMGRGVDLPDEACRVQMITKIPFPYIKDRQVSKRMYSQGGRLWYAVQTVRELVQMCGRAIRSKDDWAVTYIYDKDFDSLWTRNRSLFPIWFREAIQWR